jgi:hypothetical protein
MLVIRMGNAAKTSADAAMPANDGNIPCRRAVNDNHPAQLTPDGRMDTGSAGERWGSSIGAPQGSNGKSLVT